MGRRSVVCIGLFVLIAAVGDAAKHAVPEDSFLEDDGKSGGKAGHVETGGPSCALAWMNKERGCKDPRKMACLEGAFTGSWFALNKQVIKKATSNMTERADQMREGFWINGQDIRPEYTKKLPDDDLFAHLDLPVHRCALVSSSGALLGSGLGPRIDAHHLVMRLNNAPVAGFEKDVGRRTTLRLTAAPFSGFRERDDEAVVATWCPENSKCGLKQELETLLDKKVYPLNPRFWKYVSSAYFRKRGVEVSSGMVAFALLAHHCEHVSLFGFSGADARDWYYVKREARFKQIAQSEWMSNKAWTVDEWKLVAPKKRGSEKRAAMEAAEAADAEAGRHAEAAVAEYAAAVAAEAPAAAQQAPQAAAAKQPEQAAAAAPQAAAAAEPHGTDDGDEAPVDDAADGIELPGERRLLLEILQGAGGPLLGPRWGSEEVEVAPEFPLRRGARRALLGSLDVERQCFFTLASKGVIDIYNGTAEEARSVSVEQRPAASQGASPQRAAARSGAAAGAGAGGAAGRGRAASEGRPSAGAAAGVARAAGGARAQGGNAAAGGGAGGKAGRASSAASGGAGGASGAGAGRKGSAGAGAGAAGGGAAGKQGAASGARASTAAPAAGKKQAAVGGAAAGGQQQGGSGAAPAKKKQATPAWDDDEEEDRR